MPSIETDNGNYYIQADYTGGCHEVSHAKIANFPRFQISKFIPSGCQIERESASLTLGLDKFGIAPKRESLSLIIGLPLLRHHQNCSNNIVCGYCYRRNGRVRLSLVHSSHTDLPFLHDINDGGKRTTQS